MPYYPLEAFCHITYPQELTYEQLLTCEADLIAALEAQLAAARAVHVDVFPDGDSLKVHCAFAELGPEAFDELARDLAEPILRCGQARLMLLRKDLSAARLAVYGQGAVDIHDIALE